MNPGRPDGHYMELYISWEFPGGRIICYSIILDEVPKVSGFPAILGINLWGKDLKVEESHALINEPKDVE